MSASPPALGSAERLESRCSTFRPGRVFVVLCIWSCSRRVLESRRSTCIWACFRMFFVIDRVINYLVIVVVFPKLLCCLIRTFLAGSPGLQGSQEDIEGLLVQREDLTRRSVESRQCARARVPWQTHSHQLLRADRDQWTQPMSVPDHTGSAEESADSWSLNGHRTKSIGALRHRNSH